MLQSIHYSSINDERDSAIPNIIGYTEGLKKSLLTRLERLYRRRLDKDEIVNPDLAEEICEITLSANRPITVLLDRRGRVEWVAVGDAEALDQMKPLLPPERYSGPNDLFCLHSHIGWHPPEIGDQVTLLQFHFPLMAVLIAGTHQGFSKSKGESPKFCDGVFLLRPISDPNLPQGLDTEVSEPMTIHQAGDQSLETWLTWGDEPFEALKSGFRVREKQKVILAGVYPPGKQSQLEAQETLAELAQLVETLGYDIVSTVTQNRAHPDGKTYLGKGKAEELALEIQKNGAACVIVDDDLSPVQQRQLETAVRIPVLDRTQIIINIFAQRAGSSEGKLQVELARLQYELPRLRGQGRAFSQQTAAGRGSGVTATRGPGETQLEADRRVLRARITQLEEEVQSISRHRRHQRQRRLSQDVPVVALVGYTNAGKSTLMRALTGADVLVENKLFATLDPTTRQLWLPSGNRVLLTDTVGFIRKLPTFLVKSFQATLEEVTEADLILHVWDISHVDRMSHLHTVEETLDSLGALDIPRMTLCNKIDQVSPEGLEEALREAPQPRIPISAIQGNGIPELLACLDEIAVAGAEESSHVSLPEELHNL